MNIPLWLALLLLFGSGVRAAGTDPADLFHEARGAAAEQRYRKSLRLVEQANAIWESQNASSADYVESLTLEAILLVRKGAEDRPRAQEDLARAIGICRANQAIDPEDLALALEVEALVTRGNNMRDTVQWKEASAIRARRLSEEIRAPVGPEPEAIRGLNFLPGTKPPKLIMRVQPEYADAARILQVQGVVQIAMVIETDGTISTGTLTYGLGFGLDEEAAKAVLKWRFKPAMKDGSPVRCFGHLEISFKLI